MFAFVCTSTCNVNDATHLSLSLWWGTTRSRARKGSGQIPHPHSILLTTFIPCPTTAFQVDAKVQLDSTTVMTWRCGSRTRSQACIIHLAGVGEHGTRQRRWGRSSFKPSKVCHLFICPAAHPRLRWLTARAHPLQPLLQLLLRHPCQHQPLPCTPRLPPLCAHPISSAKATTRHVNLPCL